MNRIWSCLCLGLLLSLCGSTLAQAQLVPEIGFMHPAGAQPGTTVDVILGGYDWTPDMQLFVHDPRIKLELTGAPSGVLVPEPPYWFGAKGRGYAWPLCREFPARLTIPADVPPGLIKWQAANANGASPTGLIFVSAAPAVAEVAKRTEPQELPALPVTVSGQIRRIEEVDEYVFRAPQAGIVTLELLARSLNSPLHGMVKVRDASQKVIADVADTEGRDLSVSFSVLANEAYTVSLHDLDFAGDRSYVYCLSLKLGPKVLATYPALAQRGSTQTVEFVGLGLATGASKMESVIREIAVPPTADAVTHPVRIDTPCGVAEYNIPLSGITELVKPVGAGPMALPTPAPTGLAVTGAFEKRFGVEEFRIPLSKDQTWRFAAAARSHGSPLDLELTLLSPEGKELKTSDDAPATTDAVLTFTIPADGIYQVRLADRSGKSGTRTANYRLSLQPELEDFELTVPATANVLLGGEAKLAVKIVRTGPFKGPINVTLSGLPEGIPVPPEQIIAPDKAEIQFDLKVAADVPVTAALAKATFTTTLNGQPVTRTVPVLTAIAMKPRIKITPEGLDDVRKVHRGSTYLAPLLLQRLEGFNGDLVLEMTSKQQRHRQGLASGEMVVPPGPTRVEYPIFVPEWMETTKTSRMILNGVVKVPDPRGTVRTLVQRMELRIGILPEGALLRLAHGAGEFTVAPGKELELPLVLSVATEMQSPIQIQLGLTPEQAGLFTLDPQTVAQGQTKSVVKIQVANDPRAQGQQTLRLRAVASKDGHPVVSETSVQVQVSP